jgi:hypothetical protein
MGSASPPTTPATADDCKKDGWKTYGFKNQGQCVSAVNPAPRDNASGQHQGDKSRR